MRIVSYYILAFATCLIFGTEPNGEAGIAREEGRRHEGNLDLEEAGSGEGHSTGQEANADQGEEEEHLAHENSTSIVQTVPELSTGVHTAVLEFGTKIGTSATAISVGAIFAILASLNRAQSTSLSDKLLVTACVVSMITSFVSGGTLLLFPLFSIRVFQPDDPESNKKIKAITGVAIGSMTLVVSFAAVIIVRRAY